MPDTAPLPSNRKHRLLFLCMLAISSGACLARTDADAEAIKRLTADCTLEAEAGGLSGKDLDQFIKECVADLLSVEIHNLQEE